MQVSRLGWMAGILGIFMGAALSSPTTAQAARKPYRVLLTYFEPFHGNAANSGDRAAHDAEKLILERAGRRFRVEVKLCRLSVRYSVVMTQFKDCLRDRNPWDLVVGLGQGFDFRVEEVGILRSANIVDEWGVGDGPGEYEVGLRAHEDLISYSRSAIDRFEAQRKTQNRTLSFTRSEDAGSFVCNYYAMRAAHLLHERKTRFAFFHLPSSDYLYEVKNGWEEIALDLADFIQIALRTKPSQPVYRPDPAPLSGPPPLA